MGYGGFKDLAKGTVSDTLVRVKAFDIAKNPKYDGYQRGRASVVYNFFDKKSASGSGVTTLANKFAFNNDIKQNLQLAEELHKPVIKNLKQKQLILDSYFGWRFR